MLHIKYFLVSIFLLNSYLIFTQGENSQKLSLDDAIQYAFNNNKSIKNAFIDELIAKKKVWETTAIGLPQINGSISYQYLPSVPQAAFPQTILSEEPIHNPTEGLPQTISAVNVANDSVFLNMVDGEAFDMGLKNSATFELMVTQLIFSGEYIVGLQASRTYKELSSRNTIKTKHDIKAQVTQAYYMALIMDENVKTLGESLENLKKIASEMQGLFEEGFIEDTDLDQINLNILSIENAQSSLKRQVELSYLLLKYNIGMDLIQEIELTESLEKIIDNAGLNVLINDEFKPENNIDYQLMETSVKLSELSLKREKSKFLPTVSGFYRHQEYSNTPDFDFNIPDIIGISVNMPLMTSGGNVSKVQQAQLDLEKARNNQHLASDGLLLEYEQTKSSLLNSYEKLNNEKKMMELSKKIYDKTILKYDEGVSSSMDLTQSQNQYLSSRSTYYSTLLEYLTAFTKFEKLLSTE